MSEQATSEPFLSDKGNRRNALHEKLIAEHGRILGGCLYPIYIGGLTLSMFLFLALVLFCAGIVVDSSYHISTLVNVATVVIVSFGFYIYLNVLSVTDAADFSKFLNRYFSLQASIAVLGFIQTFFWMIDSANLLALHEPRSVFLISMSAFLAYFRDKFVRFAEQLRRHVLELEAAKAEVLPFLDTQQSIYHIDDETSIAEVQHSPLLNDH